MLLLGERLQNTPVMSLQVGAKIAETGEAVINPSNLQILAYEVEGPLLETHPMFVRIADIRELSDIGMIIDSSDELITETDVIRIKDIRALKFNLIGMRVIDTNGKKLGKVSDYTVDTDSFLIQQLSVRGGVLSSLSTTGHVIHRSQITEINNTSIIVKSGEKKLTSLQTSGQIHRNYSNPFRKTPDAQPEARNAN